ncbi:MAG: phosphoesterase, partial [Deltaproteobacteria bacterium]|nr:phosphoesterase [Deltaproteobacteria bacterium]
IRSSDAHFLKDIGKAFTSFFIEAPNLKELGLALEGKDDRKVLG